MNFLSNRLHKVVYVFPLLFLLSFYFFIPIEKVEAIWAPGDRIVPCDGTSRPIGEEVQGPGKECDFNSLIQLGQNLISFMLWLAIPVSMLIFAYAGWLYMAAFGDTGKVKKAHTIFRNLAVGIIIMGVAWLFVYILTEALLSPSYRAERLLEQPQ